MRALMLLVLAGSVVMIEAPGPVSLIAYGICQTGCNAVWVACCAAAGAVAGVALGPASPAAMVAAVTACNAAQGLCMAGCWAALIFTPA